MNSRLDRISLLLEEISTKYPSDLAEVEDYLIDLISYYSDRDDYIAPEKVEYELIRCKILPAEVRPPLILDFDYE